MDSPTQEISIPLEDSEDVNEEKVSPSKETEERPPSSQSSIPASPTNRNVSPIPDSLPTQSPVPFSPQPIVIPTTEEYSYSPPPPISPVLSVQGKPELEEVVEPVEPVEEPLPVEEEPVAEPIECIQSEAQEDPIELDLPTEEEIVIEYQSSHQVEQQSEEVEEEERVDTPPIEEEEQEVLPVVAAFIPEEPTIFDKESNQAEEEGYQQYQREHQQDMTDDYQEINHNNDEKINNSDTMTFEEIEGEINRISENGENQKEDERGGGDGTPKGAEDMEKETEEELDSELIIHDNLEEKIDLISPISHSNTSVTDQKSTSSMEMNTSSPPQLMSPTVNPTPIAPKAATSRIVPPTKRPTSSIKVPSLPSKPIEKAAPSPKPSPMPRVAALPTPPSSRPSLPAVPRASRSTIPSSSTSRANSRATSQNRNGSQSNLNSLPTTPKINKKYANVQSKVGSITSHKPSGGNVEIFHEKKVYQVTSKVGSLDNATHTPGGGDVKIEVVKTNFKETAKPRVDAKSDYVPTVSDKKIITQQLSWSAQSKVGSLDNAKHKPQGGNVKILNQKLEWNANSKVGSRDNIGHKPGGGNVEIFDERLVMLPRAALSSKGGSREDIGRSSNNSTSAL